VSAPELGKAAYGVERGVLTGRQSWREEKDETVSDQGGTTAPLNALS